MVLRGAAGHRRTVSAASVPGGCTPSPARCGQPGTTAGAGRSPPRVRHRPSPRGAATSTRARPPHVCADRTVADAQCRGDLLVAVALSWMLARFAESWTLNRPRPYRSKVGPRKTSTGTPPAGRAAFVMCARLQTVVETSAAKGLLSDSERGEVVNMVAENPEMGLWARRLGDTGRRYRSPHDRSARSGQRTGEGHPARPALSGRGGSRPSSGSRRALQPWDSRCRSLESLTWRLAA